ncbi:OmpA family protein [Maribacter sp. MJ134]|uniref:OmpA family protein n=1 Tax=Maribacter sp. MJ134 TaxID=2496865 RepID=UPI000F821C34|nr:OmpA family protein [Maribacter sp. MJ134]AZQ60427.1 OmpA family protein [Maribacter sp. MJ134]
MKSFHPLLKPLCFICIFLFSCSQANGQFLKKLGKRAEKAAERAVERRVDKEATEKTDQALDSILEPGSKGGNKTQVPKGVETPSPTEKPDNGAISGDGERQPTSTGPKTLKVYSKFDFVPGDKILFSDDFSNDFVGDFPSKWNTNGSGEIVSFDDDSGNWFELKGGRKTYQIANINELPENYTIEFDVETMGIDKKTSSAAKLVVIIDENDKFGYGKNTVYAYLPLCQYIERDIRIWNNVNGSNIIDNYVGADIREDIISRPHISIAVNKERYRLYINETKHIDIPKLIAPNAPLNSLKFQLVGINEGKDRVFINNVKIAEGGIDLRRTLMKDGKVSTNGILFDSGSANIQPQSMGIIRQIYQVLQKDNKLNLNIVGHTDADGNQDANLKLSKNRAEAVKNALVSIYSIEESRLSTEGKGASEPMGDNSTIEGKAQNRRVEFIKQ